MSRALMVVALLLGAAVIVIGAYAATEVVWKARLRTLAERSDIELGFERRRGVLRLTEVTNIDLQVAPLDDLRELLHERNLRLVGFYNSTGPFPGDDYSVIHVYSAVRVTINDCTFREKDAGMLPVFGFVSDLQLSNSRIDVRVLEKSGLSRASYIVVADTELHGELNLEDHQKLQRHEPANWQKDSR